MRVQFDLCPAEYLARRKKRHSFNATRILAVLLLLFFLVAGIGYIVMAFMETRALASDIEMVEDAVAKLEADQSELTAEIVRLKNKEQQYAKTLQIMRNEPPTIEALSALETNMDQGMGITSIRFAPGGTNEGGLVVYTADVDATALVEDQITALTTGLSGRGVFSGVTMPSSQKDEKTGRVDFKLHLELRPFGQIDMTGAADSTGKEPNP